MFIIILCSQEEKEATSVFVFNLVFNLYINEIHYQSKVNFYFV